jgi:hypothetical protein
MSRAYQVFLDWAERCGRVFQLLRAPSTPPPRACCTVTGVVFDMGLVSEAAQEEISERIEEVVQLVHWQQAQWEQVRRSRRVARGVSRRQWWLSSRNSRAAVRFVHF